jgi:hypothetical protein
VASRAKPTQAVRRQFCWRGAAGAAGAQGVRRDDVIVGAGNLSARSIQLGTAVAPSLAQRLQGMRGPKDGTVASSGQPSILTAPHSRSAVTNKPRTPCRRMLPSVIGRIGSSFLAMLQAKNGQGTKSSEPLYCRPRLRHGD